MTRGNIQSERCLLDPVLLRLDASDLLSCARVSRAWRAAVDSSARWRELTGLKPKDQPDVVSAKREVRHDLFSRMNVRGGRFCERKLTGPSNPVSGAFCYPEDVRVSWSPNGCYLTVAKRDQSLRLFHTATSREAFVTRTHWIPNYYTESTFTETGWSEDSRRLFYAAPGGKVGFFDTVTNAMTVLFSHTQACRLTWKEDLLQLSIDYSENYLEVSFAPDFSTHEMSLVRYLPRDEDLDWQLSVSSDGTKRASLSTEGYLSVHQTSDGRRLGLTYIDMVLNEGPDILWSPDSTKILIGSWTSRQLFDSHGTLLHRADIDDGWTDLLSWSPDGSKFASVLDSAVCIQALSNFETRIYIPVNTCNLATHWTKDSTRILLSTTQALMDVEAATGRVLSELTGTLHHSSEARFSDDGHHLSYLTDEGSIFNVNIDTQEIIPFPQRVAIEDFEWSPDWLQVALSGVDGSLTVLDFRAPLHLARHAC